MSSRREQKERARRERIAREQAEAREAVRRRRLWIGGGAAAAVAIAIAIVVLAVSNGGGGGTSATSDATPVPAAARQGLLTTTAPWAPQYADLSQRADAMGLPPPSDSVFHHHAWLQIFAASRQVPVPANIGIDAQTQFVSPLHTHDASGIVHIESAEPYPFTLGQFFTVWGVKLTSSQLGGYQAGPGKVLRVYVNGKRVARPQNYVMQEHDKIVVGYGRPGSFPTKIKQPFPAGL